MLKFPDHTRVGLNVLNDVMVELKAENRPTTSETAEEMIKRLEEKRNFFPSSAVVRREYAVALLNEYRNFVKVK